MVFRAEKICMVSFWKMLLAKKKKKTAPKLNRNLMYIYKTEMKKYKHTPW